MADPAGENISVSVRVRPINKREEETAEKQAWRIVDGHTIYPSEHNPRKNNLENPFAFGESPGRRLRITTIPSGLCQMLSFNPKSTSLPPSASAPPSHCPPALRRPSKFSPHTGMTAHPQRCRQCVRPGQHRGAGLRPVRAEHHQLGHGGPQRHHLLLRADEQWQDAHDAR